MNIYIFTKTRTLLESVYPLPATLVVKTLLPSPKLIVAVISVPWGIVTSHSIISFTIAVGGHTRAGDLISVIA